MTETGDAQPPPALAPHPPASSEDPVAAAAAQLVADVFVQLGVQELQRAAAGDTATAQAGRADECSGADLAQEMSSDGGPAGAAPAEAAIHVAAPSLPDEVLRHMVEEDGLPLEPDTSRFAQAAPEKVNEGAQLEQDEAPDSAASAGCPSPDEQPATAASAEVAEPAEGAPDLATCQGMAVLQPELSAPAPADAEQALITGEEPCPAAAATSNPAAAADEEQEAVCDAAEMPAEHSQPAASGQALLLEQFMGEHLKVAPAGSTGSEPAPRLSDGLLDDFQELDAGKEPAADQDAPAALPVSWLATADAPQDAVDAGTGTPPLLGNEQLVEPGAKPAADAGLLALAAGAEQEASIDAATEEGTAAQPDAESESSTGEVQPDVAGEQEAADGESAAVELEDADGEAAAEPEGADGEAAPELKDAVREAAVELGAAEEEAGQGLGLLAVSSSAALALAANDMPAGGDDATAADSYSQALNREVSAKLLAVLSQQQLQVQQLGEQATVPAIGAESPDADSPDNLLALGGEAEDALSFGTGAQPMQAAPLPVPALLPGEVAGGGSASQPLGAAATLLKWSPPGPRKGGPHLRRAAAPAVRSTGVAAASLAATTSPGPHSPTHRQRMAPLPAHSPTAIARASGASPVLGKSASAGRTRPAAAAISGAAGRQRRLSKPSMHEILRAAGQPGLRHASAGTAGSRHPAGSLPTAPLLAGGTPVQLGGGGVAPGPFPAMGDAPASALLHWGARPEALVAPAMLAGPAGWFVPVPTQGPGAQGGYLLQPSMMMGPTGMYLPYAQPGEAAGAAGARADAAYMDGSHDIAATSLDPAAGESASGGLNGGTAEQHSMGEPAEQEHDQGAAAAAAYAREEGLEVPADSALQPAEGADLQEQCDVAASWPPYKGAKLPPLRQGHMSGVGLIPAVHAASSFSVAPTQRGHSAQFSQVPASWAAPSGLASPAWQAGPAGAFWPGQPGMAAQPQQWGMAGAAGYAPGSIEEQQQAAAMHFFLQQQQAAAAAQLQHAQQAAAYGHAQQYAAQQGYADAGMHEDGPVFYRELPPPVPVAIDARGRPFKVFHGVAARSLRRPERYQGDGRPAWSR